MSAITLPTEFTDKKTDMNIEKSINTPARHPPSSIRSESSEEVCCTELQFNKKMLCEMDERRVCIIYNSVML